MKTTLLCIAGAAAIMASTNAGAAAATDVVTIQCYSNGGKVVVYGFSSNDTTLTPPIIYQTESTGCANYLSYLMGLNYKAISIVGSDMGSLYTLTRTRKR